MKFDKYKILKNWKTYSNNFNMNKKNGNQKYGTKYKART